MNYVYNMNVPWFHVLWKTNKYGYRHQILYLEFLLVGLICIYIFSVNIYIYVYIFYILIMEFYSKFEIWIYIYLLYKHFGKLIAWVSINFTLIRIGGSYPILTLTIGNKREGIENKLKTYIFFFLHPLTILFTIVSL